MDTRAPGFGLRRCVFVAILTTTADCLVWGFSGFDQATEADGFTHAKQRPSSGQTCDLRMRVTQRRLTPELSGGEAVNSDELLAVARRRGETK